MLNYRPDIDGLRAIAVGSVVLYHLDESLLAGGFVGVDIFFVISGYLITKLIANELTETGEFSFKRFYLRRVRRLFPALLATLLFCLALSYFLLSPTDLIDFSKSLVTAVLSVSNIFFWSEVGYFDSDSSLKPLLHTWSLSVEEQFYFIWPAVLVGLFAIKRPRVIPAFIIIVGIASWLLNQWFFSQQATISTWFGAKDNQAALDIASTAFYWLPFRVFEFALGAILVWLPSSKTRFEFMGEILFALGFIMILASVVSFDDTIQFPSSAALLPCVGAALMIYSGSLGRGLHGRGLHGRGLHGRGPSGKGLHRLSILVSNRIMVGLGLISYSLYLIHWPLIVFYKYWVGRDFTLPECLTIVLIALSLAYLMYRFIEQPFRRPKPESKGNKSPNRRFLLGSLGAATAIVLVSSSAFASNGWLWRYPADVVAQLSYKKGDYTEYFWANINRHKAGFIDNGKPKVLVIGDSMAAGLLNVLAAGEAEQDIDIASILISDNCKTLFGLSNKEYQQLYSGAKATCKREHDRALSKLELLSKADTIILATYWWERHFLNYLPSTIAHLTALSSANIKVLGLKVQQNDGIWFLSKHAFKPQVEKLRTSPHPHALGLNKLLESRAENYDYFDMLNLFCNAEGCQRVTKDRYVIIFDSTHFSEKGADFAAKRLKQQDWYQSLIALPSGT